MLAELLRSKEMPAFSYLVGLRGEGSGRPLFIVHGVFGNVLELRRLGERLRTKRPVYAVQARGADLSQEPHRTIAEMAVAYLDPIRARQPRGPYALAGYSAGGLIAFEMARRLVEAGEEVDLLALIDTAVHERNLPLAHWFAYHAILVSRVLRRLRVLPPRQWPRHLLRNIAVFFHRVLLRFALTQPGDPRSASSEALTARNREMYKDFVREYVVYRPRRFPGKITLFRTSGGALDPLPVWRKVADAVQVFPIAGAHTTIMEEGYVDALASRLSESLDGIDHQSRSRAREAPEHVAHVDDEYGAEIC
jgi:acetoacetyl-CoA synthetase